MSYFATTPAAYADDEHIVAFSLFQMLQAIGAASGFFLGGAYLLTETNVLPVLLVSLAVVTFLIFIVADLDFNARDKRKRHLNPDK